MADDKPWWFRFFPHLWLNDPALRMCSPGARGIWMDLLCIMALCKPRGILRANGMPWTQENIIQRIGDCTPEFLDELFLHEVARKKGDGSLYSARLIQEEGLRKERAKSGRKGGYASGKTRSQAEAKPKQKGKQTPQQTSNSNSNSVDASLIPMGLRHSEFLRAWGKWLEYRREIKKPLKRSSQNLLLARLAKHGGPGAIDLIERAIANGWTGCIFPGDRPNKGLDQDKPRQDIASDEHYA